MAVTRVIFCGHDLTGFYAPISHNIKTTHILRKNIDHLVAMQNCAEKGRVLATDMHSVTRHCCSPSIPPNDNVHDLCFGGWCQVV